MAWPSPTRLRQRAESVPDRCESPPSPAATKDRALRASRTERSCRGRHPQIERISSAPRAQTGRRQAPPRRGQRQQHNGTSGQHRKTGDLGRGGDGPVRRQPGADDRVQRGDARAPAAAADPGRRRARAGRERRGGQAGAVAGGVGVHHGGRVGGHRDHALAAHPGGPVPAAGLPVGHDPRVCAAAGRAGAGAQQAAAVRVLDGVAGDDHGDVERHAAADDEPDRRRALHARGRAAGRAAGRDHVLVRLPGAVHRAGRAAVPAAAAAQEPRVRPAAAAGRRLPAGAGRAPGRLPAAGPAHPGVLVRPHGDLQLRAAAAAALRAAAAAADAAAAAAAVARAADPPAAGAAVAAARGGADLDRQPRAPAAAGHAARARARPLRPAGRDRAPAAAADRQPARAGAGRAARGLAAHLGAHHAHAHDQGRPPPPPPRGPQAPAVARDSQHQHVRPRRRARRARRRRRRRRAHPRARAPPAVVAPQPPQSSQLALSGRIELHNTRPS
ncbi:uncharacterized protein V1510DRAFT_129432 [Dipodascopsis tothii]|uniref:uncharacterized protein n=1 Tax=Dipodascopsis tothii TaxID=44089 RepID=UPI0034CFAA3F